MKEDKLRKTALVGICAFLAVAAASVILKYILPVMLPFMLAYLLSLVFRPAAKAISGKTRLPEGAVTAVLITVSSVVAVWLVAIAATSLVKEAGEAVSALAETLRQKDSPTGEIVKWLTDAAGTLNIRNADAGQTVQSFFEGIAAKLSSWITDAAGRAVSYLPSLALFSVVWIVSLYYFTAGEKKGKESRWGILKLLPDSVIDCVREALRITKRAVKRFAKAYLLILVLTFIQLWAGFAVLRVEYAFLCALTVSLIDILPVLGVGTVLVPWAVLLFFEGETAKAVGMLVLLAIVCTVRQFTEPRIVAAGAGVHPVAALGAVYAGFKLAGVAGMLVSPFILNVAAILLEEKLKEPKK